MQGQFFNLDLSGYVMDEMTGTPVANHVVTAEIMSAGYIETYDFLTNDAGFYGDSIPINSFGDLLVWTVDCMGNIHSYSDSFDPGNLSFNYDFFICTDSIPGGCVASFDYTGSPAGGTALFFTNTSTGNPTDWFWDFGDGTTSSEFNPVHTFPEEGIYPVCLTIWSNDSTCFDIYCEDVIVGNGGGSDCENFFWYESWNMIDFAFMGESVPYPADYYHWDFGDGNTGEGQTVMHSYDPNLNDVVLVTLMTFVWDPVTGDTCVAESSQEVWIGNPFGDCENWFWGETNDQFTFEFFGEGIPPADAYFWDFGDGETASGQNVEHTYDVSSAGEVFVTLTTMHLTPGTIDSCMATSMQIIIVGDSIYDDCENFFWYIPTGDYTYLFTGEAFPVPAEEYIWDFGDGTTGYGQEIEHTFDPSVGDAFVVTLTTMSYTPMGDSCVAASSQEVWINNGGWDCENWFWYDTWDFETFDFYAESFPFPADEYYWDFGDGNTGMGQEVSHTYNAVPGEVFLVSLITIGYDPVTGDSCIAESYQEVIVGGYVSDCENWFWYFSEDYTYEFMGESFPIPADEYYWDFGDGTTATGQMVTHTFDPAMGNTFLVCLTTYSYDPASDSCVAESCQEIYLEGQWGQEIFGTVYADNVPADFALVGLFGTDPSGSFVYDFTTTEPGTGFYFFENVPDGDYYIFTSLTPQSAYFFDYFPTYYGDASSWFDATLVSLGEPENPYDINLVPVTAITSGPGSVNGTVTIDDGKKGPGENITVVIMDEDDNPIKFVQTNEAGEFEFEDLSMGTYHVKVELPGVTSEIAEIVLTDDNLSMEITFNIKDNTAYLSVSDNQLFMAELGDIYPNPVDKTAYLEFTLEKDSEINVRILNQMGQTIEQFDFTLSRGEQIKQFKTDQLPSGVYSLQLIDSKGNMALKKFVK